MGSRVWVSCGSEFVCVGLGVSVGCAMAGLGVKVAISDAGGGK